MKFSQEINEMQENTVKPSWILNAGNTCMRPNVHTENHEWISF